MSKTHVNKLFKAFTFGEPQLQFEVETLPESNFVVANKPKVVNKCTKATAGFCQTNGGRCVLDLENNYHWVLAYGRTRVLNPQELSVILTLSCSLNLLNTSSHNYFTLGAGVGHSEDKQKLANPFSNR